MAGGRYKIISFNDRPSYADVSNLPDRRGLNNIILLFCAYAAAAVRLLPASLPKLLYLLKDNNNIILDLKKCDSYNM